MAKVEQQNTDITGKYARVMHHIGGLTGKNDNSDMIIGGESEFRLITKEELPEGTDVARLVSLGAIREATPDEVERWEVSKGMREAREDTPFVFRTSGNEGGVAALQGTEGTGGEQSPDKTLQEVGTADEVAAAAQAQGGIIMSSDKTDTGTGGAGVASTGTQEVTNDTANTYKGMGKGELSEYTVPELKDFAKNEGVEGYHTMLKDELLDALLATNAK